jgi:hypothetical protein
MKVLSMIGIFAGLTALSVLGGRPARAQSEIDPGPFGSPNVEPLEKANSNASSEAMTVRYEGKFSLPYEVQCNGRRLPPGRYSVSVRSGGEVGQATLNQKDKTIRILGIVQKQTHKRGDALIVELRGKARTLSAIQVAELDLVFDSELKIENSPNGNPRRIEKLRLTGAPKK